MRRVINNVLGIVEGVDVKINFDPIVDLTRAHAPTHARLISITSKGMSKRIAKETCQPAGSAANFARIRHSPARVVEWQTRTFEGRMPKGMRVQVPPRAPNLQRVNNVFAAQRLDSSR